MIPTRAITTPSRRTLEVLAGRHGLFDELRDPFRLDRAPFRITARTLLGEPEEIEHALEVLAGLAPSHTEWFAERLLDLGQGRGVWRVSGRILQATTSRRLSAPPLVEHTTPRWYAVYGLPRLPDGVHSITAGGRRLLVRP